MMSDLSLQKQAKRLRIYINESDRWRGSTLYSALLETLRKHGAAGATVYQGQAGYGAHSRIHTTAIEVLMVDLPVVVEVIDRPEKIAALLDVIYPMIREGLITVEDVEIVKYSHRYLNPLPSDRLVSEVMTRDVVTLSPETPVRQAWQLMFEKVVKAIPVVESTGTVVGIVTDEDLFERAGIQQRLSVAIRMDPSEVQNEMHALETSPLKVSNVMTQPVITASENETIGVATARMVKAGLKRLPVVNENGKLVGMLSRLDILRQVANSPNPKPPEHISPQAVRTVKDVMTRRIPLINEDDELSTIIEKFAVCESHRLVVVEETGKAIGLVSDSDIVTRVQPAQRGSILSAFRRGGKPVAGKETAYDLMSPVPLTAPPDLPVVDAVQKMLSESRKWLVVVDDQGKPLGLVDRQILLEAVTVV
jgi:CBS domain-containing protein